MALMSIAEISQLPGAPSTRNVRNACADGTLPATLSGKGSSWLVEQRDVTEWLEAREEARRQLSCDRVPQRFLDALSSIVDAFRAGEIDAPTARAYVCAEEPHRAWANRETSPLPPSSLDPIKLLLST